MRMPGFLVLSLLVACGGAAARPADAPGAASGSTPATPAFRARLEIDTIEVNGAPHPVDGWTDIVVEGTGPAHRRVCGGVVASRLRKLKVARTTGHVVRDCALDALPPLPEPAGQGRLLADRETVEDGAIVIDYTPFPTRAACDRAREELDVQRRAAAQEGMERAREWTAREREEVAAERDEYCPRQDRDPAAKQACEQAEALLATLDARDRTPAGPPPPPAFTITCE